LSPVIAAIRLRRPVERLAALCLSDTELQEREKSFTAGGFGLAGAYLRG